MKHQQNIRRIDTDANRTHAWLVQIQRSSMVTIKMFSDGIYGGKRKSFVAALNFKTDVLATFSNYEYQLQRRTLVRKNSTSGISGVGRYEVIQNLKTGRKVAFWTAYWDDEFGVRHSSKYYVSYYGERTAKKLAVAKRKVMLQQVCTVKYT